MVVSAFGPAYAYPLIARFSAEGPRSAVLATRIIHTIERKMQIPAAIVMPFLGLALIYLGHFDLWKSEWLVISIVLYIIAFYYSVFVQTPLVGRMAAALAEAPPPPPTLRRHRACHPPSLR